MTRPSRAEWQAKLGDTRHLQGIDTHGAPPKSRRTLATICAEQRGVEVELPGTCVLGVDPGPAESAWVILYDGKILDFANQENNALLEALRNGWPLNTYPNCRMAMEQIRGYGRAVAFETIETCRQSGCIVEAGRRLNPVLVTRPQIIKHVTGTNKSNGSSSDSRVRKALIMRLGKQGKGITKHLWAALATAVTVADKLRLEPQCKSQS